MKITFNDQLSNVPDYEDFLRFIVPILSQIKDSINGGINSVDNLSAQIISYNFVAGNTTYAVNHGLGAVPNGYIKVSGPDIRIFDGIGKTTKDQIFLQASAPGTASVMVFI